MKVALVHDWLIHMRGGEKVLEALAEIFPEATVYTLFYSKRKLSPILNQMNIKSSFLQHLPGIRYYYRWLLPLLPKLIQTLKIKDADLVISSSHCVAKGIRIPETAHHICYCHTPMRYIWGFEKDYFGKTPIFLKPFLKQLLTHLRKWDVRINSQVDEFVANSENVKKRIQTFYKRDAQVIHPPMNQDAFRPNGSMSDYYLVVSAFVPYKRIDLVVQAFNQRIQQPQGQ